MNVISFSRVCVFEIIVAIFCRPGVKLTSRETQTSLADSTAIGTIVIPAEPITGNVSGEVGQSPGPRWFTNLDVSCQLWVADHYIRLCFYPRFIQ